MVGTSNRKLLPEYKKYLIGAAGVDPAQLPSNEPVYKNLKVAWLGSQDGPATTTANTITFSWQKLDNLIAFFPEYYADYYALHPWAREKGFKYKVRDDEQLITKEKLAAHSLTLEGVHSFVDSIKKRHYILAMVKGC